MNNDEFNELVKEWKHRLLLDDWLISAKLVENIGDEICGHCDANYVNKNAVISVLREMPKENRIVVFPIEQVLIHELLHCKFMSVENGSLESRFYEEMQHQLLEDMAYALWSAKYKKERPV